MIRLLPTANHSLRGALPFILALVLGVACSSLDRAEEPVGYAPDSGSDVTVDAPLSDTAVDAFDAWHDSPDAPCESTTGTPGRVTASHPGFQQPRCLDCHAGPSFAHDGCNLRPPNCVGCHGYNGAPHRDHATADNPASCATSSAPT